MKLFVAISGLIGAGKTTLADALGKQMGLPVYHEPVEDNVYLEDFYKDKAKHGFAMQVHLLNKRFEQHQQVVWSKDGAVQDRSIYEDKVFARMLHDGGWMERRDYETYVELFEHMSNFMRHPHLRDETEQHPPAQAGNKHVVQIAADGARDFNQHFSSPLRLQARASGA